MPAAVGISTSTRIICDVHGLRSTPRTVSFQSSNNCQVKTIVFTKFSIKIIGFSIHEICKGFAHPRLTFFGKQTNGTMPNIHGLHSNARDSSDSEGEAENHYVGGIGAQGGGRCVSWYLCLHCCIRL